MIWQSRAAPNMPRALPRPPVLFRVKGVSEPSVCMGSTIWRRADHIRSVCRFAPSASDWTTVSQGQPAGLNGWQTEHPQEEIYLIAAEFTQYTESAGRVEPVRICETLTETLPQVSRCNSSLPDAVRTYARRLSIFQICAGGNFWKPVSHAFLHPVGPPSNPVSIYS